jgi:hypothetical protein
MRYYRAYASPSWPLRTAPGPDARKADRTGALVDAHHAAHAAAETDHGRAPRRESRDGGGGVERTMVRKVTARRGARGLRLNAATVPRPASVHRGPSAEGDLGGVHTGPGEPRPVPDAHQDAWLMTQMT